MPFLSHARGISAFVLSAALAFSLSACNSGVDGPAVTEADRRQGAEQHPRLLAEFGGAYQGEDARYVARIGARIADAGGLSGRCTFTLVNTDVVNAFAVPGCYIYVTRGLLGIVNSEGELASVLAHELGHITANHAGQQQRRSVLSNLGVFAVSVISGSDRLTRIAGAAAQLFDLRYSREHEYEADTLGMGYLRKAGYDPFAAEDMLKALQRYSAFQDDESQGEGGSQGVKRIPEWALTHPLTENRIERAHEQAIKTGLKPHALPEYKAEYLREVDGLLFGDDPEQGFVLGRRFAHPAMRIAFDAPAGFTLTNSPQAILIQGPGGLRGEFAGGPLGPDGLEGYVDNLLHSLLGDTPARVVASQPLMINGTHALVVQAEAQTGQGPVPVVVAAYAGDGAGAYHFATLGQPGSGMPDALSALFRSFRRLSPAEAASLRPRYIRLHTVRAGESEQSLTARMAADRPEKLFRAINGLDAAPHAGQTVKLVELPGD